MKHLCLAFCVFLNLALLPSLARARDPVQEFVTTVKSDLAKLDAVLQLYESKEQRESLAVENLLNGAEALRKRLTKNPLKDLDATAIEDWTGALASAARALSKAKPGAKHDQAASRLAVVHTVKKIYPLGDILLLQFNIIRGEEWLRRGNNTYAENAFNEAKAQLPLLSHHAPENITGRGKAEKGLGGKTLVEFSATAMGFLEDYLLYIRREEPMPGSAFDKAHDGIRKSLAKVNAALRAGLK